MALKLLLPGKLIMEELHGKITLNLNKKPLEALLKKHVTAYDPARFEVVALRLYFANELVLTVFAHDLQNHSSTISSDRVPVKKFKIQITSPADLLGISDNFNFTVCNDKSTLDEMEVINK